MAILARLVLWLIGVLDEVWRVAIAWLNIDRLLSLIALAVSVYAIVAAARADRILARIEGVSSRLWELASVNDERTKVSAEMLARFAQAQPSHKATEALRIAEAQAWLDERVTLATALRARGIPAVTQFTTSGEHFDVACPTPAGPLVVEIMEAAGANVTRFVARATRAGASAAVIVTTAHPNKAAREAVDRANNRNGPRVMVVIGTAADAAEQIRGLIDNRGTLVALHQRRPP